MNELTTAQAGKVLRVLLHALRTGPAQTASPDVLATILEDATAAVMSCVGEGRTDAHGNKPEDYSPLVNRIHDEVLMGPDQAKKVIAEDMKRVEAMRVQVRGDSIMPTRPLRCPANRAHKNSQAEWRKRCNECDTALVEAPPCLACFGRGSITPVDLDAFIVTCSRCQGTKIEPADAEPIHAWDNWNNNAGVMRCGALRAAVMEAAGGRPSWRIVSKGSRITYADGVTCLACLHSTTPAQVTAAAIDDNRPGRLRYCDVVTETPIPVEEQLAMLRKAIQDHRAQKADDRCIEDDDRLYAALGDGIKCDRRVGSKEEMLRNCARFIERRCEGGGWPNYRDLEASIASHRGALQQVVEVLATRKNDALDLALTIAEMHLREAHADMLAQDSAGTCGCGRPLLVSRDATGRRIGVTHTPEDEDHHLAFWSGRGPEQIAAAMDENARAVQAPAHVAPVLTAYDRVHEVVGIEGSRIYVRAIEVQSGSGAWSEAFGAAVEADAFLRGLLAAAQLFGGHLECKTERGEPLAPRGPAVCPRCNGQGCPGCGGKGSV